MEPPAPEPATGPALLSSARAQVGWSLDQLWVHYLALGGNAGVLDVEAHLDGLNALGPGEHDVLACALNERLADLGNPLRVPYTLEPGSEGDLRDALAVLELLLADDGMSHA